MKICKTCQLEKPTTEFYRNGKAGSLKPECKRCHMDTQKPIAKARHERHPEYRKNTLLKYHYGITLEQYGEILAKQTGRCKVCLSKEFGGKQKVFVIDHCHKTGRIRGLLCWHCNVAIGHLRDDPKIARAVVTYLEENVS